MFDTIPRARFVSDRMIERIQLHKYASTGATDSIAAPPAEPPGKYQSGQDQPQLDVSLLSSSSDFKMFRGVETVDTWGGVIAEKGPFIGGDYPIANGQFFFDMQRRDGVWCRIRNVDGEQGWAHRRALQLLDYPWDLPNNISILPAALIKQPEKLFYMTAEELLLEVKLRCYKSDDSEEDQQTLDYLLD